MHPLRIRSDCGRQTRNPAACQGPGFGRSPVQAPDALELPQDRKSRNSEDGGGGPGCLDSESQQVSPPSVDEALWLDLMTPVRERWEARSADPLRTTSQRLYAARRARRLTRPYADRTAQCERAGTLVRCGCPGRRAIRWYTCRQHLMCQGCQRRRSKKTGAKIRHGLEAAARVAPRGTRVVLLTLTIRHSDDVAADRRDLVATWRAFYRAYRRRWGTFAYVGTHEVTAGRDGAGHPHAHVMVLWPYRDWKKIIGLWKSCSVRDPDDVSIDLRVSHSVKHAARYMAKYVSKGVQTDEFAPGLRARVLAGTYNTRWVFTSRRFWAPFVPLCPCCGQSVVRAIVNPFRDANRTWSYRPDDGGPDGPPRVSQLDIEAIYDAEQRGRARCP